MIAFQTNIPVRAARKIYIKVLGKGNTVVISFPTNAPHLLCILESVGVPECAPVSLVPNAEPLQYMVQGRVMFDTVHWNEDGQTLEYNRHDPLNGNGVRMKTVRYLLGDDTMVTRSTLTKEGGGSCTAKAFHQREGTIAIPI